MAKGRRQEEWDRVAALAAAIVAPWLGAGETIDPRTLNPYRPPPPPTPAQVERRNRDGWRALDTVLTRIAKGEQ